MTRIAKFDSKFAVNTFKLAHNSLTSTATAMSDLQKKVTENGGSNENREMILEVRRVINEFCGFIEKNMTNPSVFVSRIDEAVELASNINIAIDMLSDTVSFVVDGKDPIEISEIGDGINRALNRAANNASAAESLITKLSKVIK